MSSSPKYCPKRTRGGDREVGRQTVGQTNGWMDRRSDGRTGRQTDIQTVRQTYRQSDGQTDGWMARQTEMRRVRTVFSSGLTLFKASLLLVTALRSPAPIAEWCEAFPFEHQSLPDDFICRHATEEMCDSSPLD